MTREFERHTIAKRVDCFAATTLPRRAHQPREVDWLRYARPVYCYNPVDRLVDIEYSVPGNATVGVSQCPALLMYSWLGQECTGIPCFGSTIEVLLLAGGQFRGPKYKRTILQHHDDNETLTILSEGSRSYQKLFRPKGATYLRR